MAARRFAYHHLLQRGIPKKALDTILHHQLLRQMDKRRYVSIHIPSASTTRRAAPFRIQYKNYRLFIRLHQCRPSGKALSLLQTGFAKKPKNPV